MADSPPLATLAAQPFMVNVGGAVLIFTPNAKGKATSPYGKLALTVKAPRKPAGAHGTLTFTVAASKGTWTGDWADEGVDPLTTRKGAITMRVDVAVNGLRYSASSACAYASKAAKGGTFRNSAR
jgi:hypothetical protein